MFSLLLCPAAGATICFGDEFPSLDNLRADADTMLYQHISLNKINFGKLGK